MPAIRQDILVTNISGGGYWRVIQTLTLEHRVNTLHEAETLKAQLEEMNKR